MRLTREQNWALMRQALDEWREKTKVLPLDIAIEKAWQEHWDREYLSSLERYRLVLDEYMDAFDYRSIVLKRGD